MPSYGGSSGPRRANARANGSPGTSSPARRWPHTTRPSLPEAEHDVGDAVEVVVRKARVERQRERAPVARLRALKRALVAVRLEQVHRIGADLRLDRRLTQRRERLVAPV